MSASHVEVTELGEAEQHALGGEIQLGQRICDFYIDRDWDDIVETLDQVLDLWLRDTREQKSRANDIDIVLGPATGNGATTSAYHARRPCCAVPKPAGRWADQ